ncbi:hypothetical protein CTAYLR_009748 [Chrysophaeum taylorii]|uniref:CDAN1-interacting nuclease 1 n=1 Tax=Chrysophaeum taylorii TaxID=2483200 RepID=A0AAD7XSW3_9STRA|nr:hypothetical protein CTAYLR_009748 [Chrysophaeum taylorii]
MGARRRRPVFCSRRGFGRKGERLAAIALRVSYPPVLVARLVLEAVVDVPKKAVGDLVRNPEKILDARLRADPRPRDRCEVIECIDTDEHYAPRHDAARHDIGIEYELILRDRLEAIDIPYEHEDQLRIRGFAKTPDVLLTIPIGFLPAESNARRELSVVNWIDSKAMFGAPAVYHNEHRQQLLAYVNRLGAGAVVYWFGFANELQDVDRDILLLSRWPDPGTLFWPDATPVV